MNEAEESVAPKKPKSFNVKLFVLTLVLGVIVVVLLGLFSGASEASLWGWALAGAGVGALFGAILGANVQIADPKKVSEADITEPGADSTAESAVNSGDGSDAAQSPESPKPEN
ncbi:hypothetical protein [Ancrocorticia populi]|uniref:hypothetical protein n=1 Tax=Ancrocorticia populi TaxID=2175228 RepID=UPI003F921250